MELVYSVKEKEIEKDVESKGKEFREEKAGNGKSKQERREGRRWKTVMNGREERKENGDKWTKE